jgi:hypothetical protein
MDKLNGYESELNWSGQVVGAGVFGQLSNRCKSG